MDERRGARDHYRDEPRETPDRSRQASAWDDREDDRGQREDDAYWQQRRERARSSPSGRLIADEPKDTPYETDPPRYGRERNMVDRVSVLMESVRLPAARVRNKAMRHKKAVLLGLAALATALVVLIVALLNTSALSDDDPLSPTNRDATLKAALIKPGTLIWGADATLGAPYVFAAPDDPSGMKGVEVDFMAALAKRLGVKLQFSQVAWASFPQALNGRTIDVFANDTAITGVPTGTALFADPYLMMANKIVTRAGDTRFTDLASLEGRPVGVITGDRGAAVVKTDPQIQAIEYADTLPFEALAAGRLDAVVVSGGIAQWYGANDTQKRFTVLTPSLASAPIAIALAPTAAHALSLRDLISAAEQAMRCDGTMKKILDTWHMTDAAQIWAPSGKGSDC